VVGFWEAYDSQELIPDPFEEPEKVVQIVWCNNATMTNIEVNQMKMTGIVGTIVTVPHAMFDLH
jgi:hypothetical protein